MSELRGFSARHLRPVESAPGHADPAPVREWPLVMSDAGVLAVCPRCGSRLKVKNIGQAWAAAKTHNEEQPS